MPYIPHDAAETAAMLAAVGVERLDQLFDEIPPVLQAQDMALPEGLSEMALQRELEGRALANAPLRCFAGAGLMPIISRPSSGKLPGAASFIPLIRRIRRKPAKVHCSSFTSIRASSPG
ncbi:glycine dehydrogenase (decarboxylating) subunit 1 [Acidithiobacillus ferridurans]|uniref:Glycine dehydrogenase (Decarboxylating) subunit 1 n=1 Tax=Acidithiobacillus ferridurans TaxID=1232575 RepID=A0A2Z6IKE2_ACIFI|nr:glycine dehydrogenase (decarboxylating) subunit 1 [Acidithiobacillus ferridurans]